MNNIGFVTQRQENDTTNIELASILWNKPFFDDYRLESVEMDNSSGQKSGKGTEHYSKDGKKYSLEAFFKNGKKEGEAILFDSAHVGIANLVFADDQLNGECVIRNDDYVVIFRGMYANGRKEGECYEYDNSGKETFHGVYRSGSRHLLFEELKSRPSFYCEYSKTDLSILSISQYSSDLSKKNGTCYLFHNGTVERECIMSNGVETSVVRLFEESNMKEMDREGRVIYEGGFGGDYISGFVRSGYGREIDKTGKILYEGVFSENKRSVVLTKEESMKRKDFYREESKDGQLLTIAQYNTTDEKNGVCFEFENSKVVRECVYEKGVMKRVVREFNGEVMSEFDSEGHKIYEGGYCGSYSVDFERNGEGKEYNATGKVIYEDGYVQGKKRITQELVTSGPFKGYYREVTYDRKVLCIGQYSSEPLKKNGKCFEFENGVVIRECTYKDNVMEKLIREFKNKIMTEFDDKGNKVYEGEYIGSYEKGFIRNGEGKEFDSAGSLLYEGPFEKGKRFAPVKRINKGKMKGYYQETTFAGEVLSIARYKKGEKNGVCFEFENSKVVRECVYEKGVMKRVVREFNGDIMSEFDSEGHKIYEGGYKGDYQTHYVRNGEGKEYDKNGSGLIYTGHFVNSYYHGSGVSIKNGFVAYKGEWKYGYPCGKGVLMNSKGVETHNGEWKKGYLKEGKVVIDFETGEKKKGLKRGYKGQARKDQRKDWWYSKSMCFRFWLGLLFWIVFMLVSYEILLTLVMATRIVFQRELKIQTCEEFTHIPFFMKGFVRRMTVTNTTCVWIPWIKEMDFSSFKNLEYLTFASNCSLNTASIFFEGL